MNAKTLLHTSRRADGVCKFLDVLGSDGVVAVGDSPDIAPGVRLRQIEHELGSAAVYVRHARRWAAQGALSAEQARQAGAAITRLGEEIEHLHAALAHIAPVRGET
jgi:hypothetical protein